MEKKAAKSHLCSTLFPRLSLSTFKEAANQGIVFRNWFLWNNKSQVYLFNNCEITVQWISGKNLCLCKLHGANKQPSVSSIIVPAHHLPYVLQLSDQVTMALSQPDLQHRIGKKCCRMIWVGRPGGSLGLSVCLVASQRRPSWWQPVRPHAKLLSVSTEKNIIHIFTAVRISYLMFHFIYVLIIAAGIRQVDDLIFAFYFCVLWYLKFWEAIICLKSI